MAIGVHAPLFQPTVIVPGSGGYKDAAIAAVELSIGNARILQGLPSFGQEQPLLGTHELRFCPGDPEKERIPIVNPI